jgi:hypothetical protein
MGIEETRTLKEALQRLKTAVGTPAEKARLFHELAKQIAQESGGTWRADRMTTSDGAIVRRRQGEVIVFTANRTLNYGRLVDI